MTKRLGQQFLTVLALHVTCAAVHAAPEKRIDDRGNVLLGARVRSSSSQPTFPTSAVLDGLIAEHAMPTRLECLGERAIGDGMTVTPRRGDCQTEYDDVEIHSAASPFNAAWRSALAHAARADDMERNLCASIRYESVAQPTPASRASG